MHSKSSAPVTRATRRRFLALSTAAGLGGTMFPGALLGLAAAEAAAQATASRPAWMVAYHIGNGRRRRSDCSDQADARAEADDAGRPRWSAQLRAAGPRAASGEQRRTGDGVRPGACGDIAASPLTGGPSSWLPLPPRSPIARRHHRFATVRQLGALLRSRKMSSLELTKLYVARLKRYDPRLQFVITLTEERALAQASAADRDSPQARIGGRCTASPGAPRTCLRSKAIPPRGARPASSIRHLTKMPRS